MLRGVAGKFELLSSIILINIDRGEAPPLFGAVLGVQGGQGNPHVPLRLFGLKQSVGFPQSTSWFQST